MSISIMRLFPPDSALLHPGSFTAIIGPVGCAACAMFGWIFSTMDTAAKFPIFFSAQTVCS